MLLPETSNNVVSILSGGLDSTILTHLLVKKYGADKVHALSFDYNQKQKIELQRAAKTCSNLGIQHKILDLSILGEIARPISANISGTDVAMPSIKDILGHPQPVTYVPYRNMLLLTFGLSFAETVKANFIFTGLQSQDAYGYWDTTYKFISDINQVSSNNRLHNIKVIAPFTELSKADEILLAVDGGFIDDLKDTLTCYNPIGELSCGKCPSCAERIAQFAKVGIKDPVDYAIELNWEELYGRF